MKKAQQGEIPTFSYTVRLYLICILIGLLSAAAALLLTAMVHSTEAFLRGIIAAGHLNYFLLLLPAAGLLLTTFFVKKVAKADLSHGVTKVLASLSHDEGRIDASMIWKPLVACTLTVGFGGSMGMEAPIMHSGSAIGSNIAKAFGLNAKDRVLLLGSGCAAAVAAIFKAPVAGALFAFEILMIDLNTKAVIPVFVSSVSGALAARIATRSALEYSFAISEAFDYRNILFYLLLGIFTALGAAYLRWISRKAGEAAKKIGFPYLRAAVGGLLLAVLILFFPTLFGEGYSGLSALLGGRQVRLLDSSPFYGMDTDGWLFVIYLAGLIFAKGAATALTGAAGGIGGIFAPGLFLGGAVGYTLARVLRLLGFGFASEANFALIGMAGLLSALLKAPLTSVFLIAEITGGYHLLIPLLITSLVAFTFSRHLFPYSVYSEPLAESGELITHDKDKAAMKRINLRDLVETDFVALRPEATIDELEHAAMSTKRLSVPILDAQRRILGTVHFERVRKLLLSDDPNIWIGLSVADVASPVDTSLGPATSAQDALAAFDESGLQELPYIDANGAFSGFVERTALLEAYRKQLHLVTIEGD